jgi:hypothetical protein
MNRDPRAKSAASPSNPHAPNLRSVTAPAPSAQRVRPRMFASPLHTARRLIEEQLACRDPVFAGILGNAKVEANIDAAKDRARSTPNFGYGPDVPANGSEHGFYAGKIPLFGAATGRVFTNHREVETKFDPVDRPWLAYGITGIHTHQSPRGAPGLSQDDINLTYPPPKGQGINIVAVDRNGVRYCKVAR